MHNPNLTPLNFVTGLGNVSYDIGIESDASSFFVVMLLAVAKRRVLQVGWSL